MSMLWSCGAVAVAAAVIIAICRLRGRPRPTAAGSRQERAQALLARCLAHDGPEMDPALVAELAALVRDYRAAGDQRGAERLERILARWTEGEGGGA